MSMPPHLLAASLVLAPLWIPQGLHTRRVTPRLPEPPGPRHGRCGEAGLPSLHVLITGDSAAAGVGARNQANALSGHLARALSAHFRLEWRLEARTGLTCRELATTLRQCEVPACDVAVVSIGVNDVTGGRRSRDWRADLEALIELLAGEMGVRRVLLSPLPPMHAFSALPQPLRWVMGQRARHFNQILRQVVTADARCCLLADEFPVRADFLASDGFHPGEAAYAHWAERIAATVLQDCSGSG